MSKGANTKRPAKRKATPGSWKPGQSGNPAGRPRDGESWATVLTWAANLTGEEAAQIAPTELRQFFRPLRGLQLKQAISLRVMAALLFEPQASLFNAVMERVEGKVTQPIDVNWREEAKEAGYDPDELVRQFAAAMVAASVQGSGEDSADGEPPDMGDDGAT